MENGYLDYNPPPLPYLANIDNVVYTIILLLLLNETPGGILVHLGSHSTSPNDTCTTTPRGVCLKTTSFI